MAQCCRNIRTSFSRCLAIQKVCLGILRIHRNVDKKYFKNSKNSERNKIMICGIHYFNTELKTKIDVIPRSNSIEINIEFKYYLTVYFTQKRNFIDYSGYFMCAVVAILDFARLCNSSGKFTLAERMDLFIMSGALCQI